jgi:hypothetical protein
MDIVNIVTSSFETTKISPLEAIMLICWGTSWPVSVFKALRTKKVYGKSPIFMSLIAVGYVSAILHKILYSYDYLVLLYLFNLSMILTDLYLYNRYNLRDTRASKRIKTREITTNKISAAPNVS